MENVRTLFGHQADAISPSRQRVLFYKAQRFYEKCRDLSTIDTIDTDAAVQDAVAYIISMGHQRLGSLEGLMVQEIFPDDIVSPKSQAAFFNAILPYGFYLADSRSASQVPKSSYGGAQVIAFRKPKPELKS
jgi:hypothetical protein